MAEKSIFNHKTLIKSMQPAQIKSIYPGMVVQFKYSAEKLTDKKPFVLVLWNDYQGYKIHGINLNYLKNSLVLDIMNELTKGANKSNPQEVENPVTEEDQDDSKYDDNKPDRNLLKKPYTKIQLPTYREEQDGRKLSKAVAEKQMKLLYEKNLKQLIKKHQMYRSYSYEKIASPKVARLDMERFKRI
tara:strand:+ start:14 stop:574 length:561 start_codon:yes stop_codon:yes gene_type:complete